MPDSQSEKRVACPLDCGFNELLEDTLELHLLHTCFNREVMCPYKCSKPKMKARELKDHQERTCSMRPVACRRGCGEMVPLDHLVLHERMQCAHRLTWCELCDQEVQSESIEIHMKTECPERAMNCPRGCGTGALTASRLELHLEMECPHRFVKCSDCQEEMHCGVLDKHLALDCPWRLVPCPNRCSPHPVPSGVSIPGADYHGELIGAPGALIKLADLDEHLDKDCPERLVPCPNGCLEERDVVTRIIARNQEYHLQEVCPNRMIECEDCGESMRHHQLKHHLSSQCQERLMSACARVCKYRCGVVCESERFKAKHLLDHMMNHCVTIHEKECPLRTLPCRLCGKPVLALERLVHEHAECPERKIQCTLNCGQRLKSKSLEGHIARSCEHRALTCTRCGSDVIFQDIDTHQRDHCASTCELGCGALVPAGGMRMHMHSCPLYFTECRYKCGQPVPVDQIEVHEQHICPFRVVPDWVHDYSKPHTASEQFCRHSPPRQTRRDESAESPGIQDVLELVEQIQPPSESERTMASPVLAEVLELVT